MVNDRLDVALAAGCGGVHLREDSLAPSDVRALAPNLLIGASVHDADGARRRADQGAHYLVLAPIFPTPGKGPALGLDLLLELRAELPIPVFALGGIRRSNVGRLLAAGVTDLAGIGLFASGAPAVGRLRRSAAG